MRLSTLEYLVCPEPPPPKGGSKAYECLAGMAPAEWERFGKAYRPEHKMQFRWFFGLGALIETPLERALPWAKPGKAEAWKREQISIFFMTQILNFLMMIFWDYKHMSLCKRKCI